jgi:tetratricopeptide (TPR) repeat protein
MWLLPVAFWPGSNSYDAAKFTLLAVATSLWLGHAGWRMWRDQPGLQLGNIGFRIWAALMFLFVLQMFTAVNASLVLRTGLLISLFALVTHQTTRQTGGLPRQKPLLAALTAGASVAGVYGLFQMAHLLPGAAPHLGYPPGISTLGNQNYLAGLMAVCIWPAVILMGHLNSGWARMGCGVALLVLLATLFQAGATGPQIAFLAAAAVTVPCLGLTIRGRGRFVPMTLGILMVLSGGSGLWFIWDSTSDYRQTTTTNNSTPSWQQTLLDANHGDIRRTDWLVAMDMMEHGSVIGGIGAGNYRIQWPVSRARVGNNNPDVDFPWGSPPSARAHNEMLQWAAETGYTGVSWLMLSLAFLAFAWRRRFLSLNSRQQVDQLLLTAGLITVAVHSMVSFPLHLPATGLVVALLLGLLFLDNSTSRPYKRPRLFRIQAAALVLMAGIILGGSLREFRADLLTASGREEYNRGRMLEAAHHLESGVQQMMWRGHACLHLGLAQTALGETEAAERNLQTSLLDRPSFEAHLALAESAINRGDFSSAESHLDLVLGCRAQLILWHQAEFLQGLMMVRQGKLDQARRKFSELLKEDPNQHRALLGLGYLAALQDHPDHAQRLYRQALQVIENQMEHHRTHPNTDSAAHLVRLEQNRTVAIQALQSLTPGP